MSEQSFTEWFPASVNPVHIGEYNASCVRDPTVLRWWNGRHWSIDYRSEHAEVTRVECRKVRTIAAGIEWRGLAKEPPRKKQPKEPRWPYNSKMQNVAKGGR